MEGSIETWSLLDDSGAEEGTRGKLEKEEDEPKVCKVCGDKATGYHFNAMTCEGCKGFFRRAMKGPCKFRCPFQNNCVITKSNRRQCQSCRLQKCLSTGMLKELIMSDEAVEKRRMLIQRKRMAEEPSVLSQEQAAIIQELLDAHKKTFDTTFSGFIKFRPPDCDERISSQLSLESYKKDKADNPVECHPSHCYTACIPGHYEEAEPGNSKGKARFTNLPHIADLSTYMIQQIIKYAKVHSYCRSLNIENQISLLKGATFEIVQMRFNMLFNEETGIWECGSLKYCLSDALPGFQAHLLDSLLKLHFTLRQLHLHDEEYVLMQAISLFSADRTGVTQHSVIDKHQEMLALTLKTYIDVNRNDPNKHLVFPKIMACLTEMRSMNEEYTKQVLQIQDMQPDLSPLVLEIFSKQS
uniref:Nuclear receptor subfamily 1 group I member 2 n=1 Tax=Electrophorus electricus TaxID=8005 RepID=A0A4W4GX94_ELEEL